MTTRDDILALITEGRLDAQRARATALSRTLSEVEGLVLEMRPTPEPVTIERGNTADLADLEEMRGILDGADWPPTPLGLSEALKRADEADELDRRHAEALATISDLRSRIGALTPGPWRTVTEEAPPRGEWIVVVMTDGCAYTAQLSENQPIDWMRLWRRLPVGLLDVPAPAVAPTNAQSEGAR